MKENMNITDSLKSNKKPILVLCVLLIACAGYFYYHQNLILCLIIQQLRLKIQIL